MMSFSSGVAVRNSFCLHFCNFSSSVFVLSACTSLYSWASSTMTKCYSGIMESLQSSVSVTTRMYFEKTPMSFVGILGYWSAKITVYHPMFCSSFSCYIVRVCGLSISWIACISSYGIVSSSDETGDAVVLDGGDITPFIPFFFFSKV